MTDTSNMPVPVPQTTPPAQLTALERYGRSGGDLYGDLLKFSGKTGPGPPAHRELRSPLVRSSPRSYRGCSPAA